MKLKYEIEIDGYTKEAVVKGTDGRQKWIWNLRNADFQIEKQFREVLTQPDNIDQRQWVRREPTGKVSIGVSGTVYPLGERDTPTFGERAEEGAA